MRRNTIDSELYAAAPKADDAFVASLAECVPTVPKRRSSALFVSAIAVLVVGSALSFGAVGYAAGSGSNDNATPSSPTSASDQYGNEDPVPPPPETTPTTTNPEPPASQPAGTNTNTDTGVKGASASGGAAPSKGTLPFTGLSLIGTVGLGLALMIAGLVLRRRENES